jgi:hypothetical protein
VCRADACRISAAVSAMQHGKYQVRVNFVIGGTDQFQGCPAPYATAAGPGRADHRWARGRSRGAREHCLAIVATRVRDLPDNPVP